MCMNANYKGGNANSSQGQVQTQAETEVKEEKKLRAGSHVLSVEIWLCFQTIAWVKILKNTTSSFHWFTKVFQMNTFHNIILEEDH